MKLLISPSLFQIGLQGPIVSTVVQVALAQPWLVVVAVCHVSATAMVTHSKVTVTTRQASATALTTLREHTVNPAFLAIMETPGKEIFSVIHVVFMSFVSELI